MMNSRGKSWIGVVLLAGTPLVSGCAIVSNGRHQEVVVVTSPVQAELTVASEPGAAYRTPTLVRLRRTKEHVLVARAQGYEEASTVVRSHVDWAVVVIDCLLLCAPLLIDWPLGAVYTLEPTTVRLELDESARPDLEGGP
jgi:hypothetical protein